MIYLIGDMESGAPDITRTGFDRLEAWMMTRRGKTVQYDVETVPAKWWPDRKLRTMQFGCWRDQYVLQWSYLTPAQQSRVAQWLEDARWTKVIHNAMFESVICRFYGIRLQGIFDTMLAEQVLWGGEQGVVGYGLDDVCWRRLGFGLDKTYQTAFVEDVLTPPLVRYAAQDVKHLEMLREDMLGELCSGKLGLDWTLALEHGALAGFSEMVYHGIELDVPHWRKLAVEAEPLVAESHQRLCKWLEDPLFKNTAYGLGYLSHEDRFLMNWNSSKQKQVIFSRLYPELPGTTKAVLKKWMSDRIRERAQDRKKAQSTAMVLDTGELIGLGELNPEIESNPYPEWLPYYLEGDYGPLERELLSHHRRWLVDEGLLIPAGQATINWNSQQQALPIFQCIDPKIRDLSADTMGRVGHGLVADYQEYKDTLKLLSSYGEKFIEKHVGPDGKVRTEFNQVLTTGRVSSKNPNMQNVPAKENVGNKYRNAFVPPRGWVFVSSDYTSQELVIIAYLSKDPVWMEALSRKQDLHSIASELIYGDKWRKAAEPGCAYYATGDDGQPAHNKCRCSKHVWMRKGIKTVDFGLSYGMSHFKLASDLRITVPEAKSIIVDFFRAFPGIGSLLTFLGNFGVENGYIQTIYPFYRKRFFREWRWYKRFIDGHIMGIHYHGYLGEIERASKNMPIQGTAADMTKTAVASINNYIHSHHLSDRVYMAMQVHDQVDCICREDFAREWAPIQTQLMEEAAKVFIPTGLLKADTTITERWSK